MASDTGSGHIRQNRPPRVNISYQDPLDADKEVELPFVMGVMSDLSGNAPRTEKEDIEQRKFEKVTSSTLDTYMEKTVQPGLQFRVQNKLDDGEGQMPVNLEFNSMADFEPASIAKQVPAMKELLDARQVLADLLLFLNSKPEMQSQIKSLLEDPERLKVLADQAREEEAAKRAAASADAAPTEDET